MAQAQKVKLTCIKTHGRWNKGDEASFSPENAKAMVEAKGAVWKIADADAPPDSDDKKTGGGKTGDK